MLPLGNSQLGYPTGPEYFLMMSLPGCLFARSRVSRNEFLFGTWMRYHSRVRDNYLISVGFGIAYWSKGVGHKDNTPQHLLSKASKGI